MRPPRPTSLTVEYERTVPDMARAAIDFNGKDPSLAYYRRHLQLLVCACALVMADVLLQWQSGYRPFLGALVLVLLCSVVANWYWRSYSPQGYDHAEKYAGRYRLGADLSGIRIEGPLMAVRHAWDLCSHFSRSPDHTFLHLAGGSVTIIPTSAFDAEQLEDFLELLTTCIGGPARCLQCGYNLSGNASGTCPECGKPISPRRV